MASMKISHKYQGL